MSRAGASGVGEGAAGPLDDSSMQREEEDSHLLLRVTHPPHLPTFICLIIRWAPRAWPFSYPNIFFQDAFLFSVTFPLHHPSGPSSMFSTLYWAKKKKGSGNLQNPVEKSEQVCRCRLPLVRVIWLSSLFFFLLFCESNNRFSQQLDVGTTKPTLARFFLPGF